MFSDKMLTFSFRNRIVVDPISPFEFVERRKRHRERRSAETWARDPVFRASVLAMSFPPLDEFVLRGKLGTACSLFRVGGLLGPPPHSPRARLLCMIVYCLLDCRLQQDSSFPLV